MSVAPPAAADRFLELPGGRRLCFRTDGDPADAPLLLVAGLGQQLTSWPEPLVADLVARGHLVVRADNRDAGRSFRAATPPPGRVRQLTRRFRADQYTLADLAEDHVAVLDELGLERVHLVGMSMGGMIVQTIAARHAQRVRSLTSIFSTTGARRVGGLALSTLRLMAQPPAADREASAERTVRLMRHIGSRGFPVDEDEIRRAAVEAWDRGDGATAQQGVARQIGAIYASGDRTAELRRITAPTLVIHGDRDPMVHPSGGDATAAAIPGARLVTIAGMGHDLPRGAWPRLVELVAGHAADADRP